jgi:DNA (cytosine-5)-methyltransferase 1
MSFVELFRGIGGFRLGLERTGWKCVWSNDIDKYSTKVYRSHFGSVGDVEGDIREVDAKTIPDHTLLTGGFPCQPFSHAGNRQGFQDVRGTLFYEILRIVEAKKPLLLLLENVEGLLSNDRGRTFGTMLEKLGNLGYWCEWQVINSRHWVPQNRPRVFIVGHSRGGSSKQVFPVTTSGRLSCEEVSNKQASKERFRSSHLRLAQTLEATYPKTKSLVNTVASALSNRYGKDGSEILIMTSHTKANIQQREQTRNESWTLDRSGNKMALKLKSGIRRLTPLECERLQGFPDGWTAKGIDTNGKEVTISDSQRYKMLGNAVTVNVVSFLGQKIKECLEFEQTQNA